MALPRASLWASMDGGFGQVGYVYAAQSFECHWNDVMLGSDFVWRTDQSPSGVTQGHDFREFERRPATG